jgi:hypothetical protein
MGNERLTIRHDLILGSKRFSNFLWSAISFIGGAGFLSVGLSSYFKIQLLTFTNTQDISFIPQGIVMTFYGTIGIFLSLFLGCCFLLNVGGGYNKYDTETQEISIFRIGFPFINNEIYLKYKFKDIESIQLSIIDGLNPKREIYLCTKDNKKIPLTRVGEPLLLSQIEEEAVTLANFLNVSLEGF